MVVTTQPRRENDRDRGQVAMEYLGFLPCCSS